MEPAESSRPRQSPDRLHYLECRGEGAAALGAVDPRRRLAAAGGEERFELPLERFGPLEATRAGANGAGSKLIVLTNIAADGSIAAPTDKQVLSNRGNQIWHTDSSF